MNILYISYPVQPFGAPHQEMAAIYLSKNHSIDFYGWGNDSPDWSFEGTGIRYHLVPKGGISSALKFLLTLFRKVRSSASKYDVIYVQGAQQTPFLFWLPFFKGNRRVIYHTQDFLEPGRHRFYERFEKWFARHADYTICNEPNRARFMQSYYGLEHMPVSIRTALPESWKVPPRNEKLRTRILNEAGVGDEGIVIFAGGTYRNDRMSSQLLTAFAQLPDQYVLVFNGPHMAEGEACRVACENNMKAEGITSRVVFFGGLEFDELLELYSSGEIGILLYPNDGVGNYYQCPGRFTEYLRCGLSLVSSDFPGLELLILKNELGAVCDAEDPESIAVALLKAGKQAKERRKPILDLTEAEFVYEKQGVLLENIVAGTHEHKKPSVTT